MCQFMHGKWNRKILQAAVVLSLTVDWTGSAFAYHDALISSKDGKPMFEVVFADQGETGSISGFSASHYTLEDAYKNAVGTGLQYWSDLLGPQSQNRKPVQVLVGTVDEANAYASTMGNGVYYGSVNYQDAIQSGKDLRWLDLRNIEQEEDWGNVAMSNIVIGKYLGAQKTGSVYGWYIDADTSLPENEQAADLIGTVRHEMGHALGISADRENIGDADEPQYVFGESAAEAKTWTAHLADRNGNLAKPGMKIVTERQFAAIRQENPDARAEDYFILNEGENAYFIGEHVSEVLQGALFDGKEALPVNGWEGSSLELSHLQTQGMMSHRSYGNYTNFMEAELAVMQDMGYAIDRKNYFGYSVYGNGMEIVNKNGYSARNAAGTAYLPGVYNQAALGVGLHLYGAHNTVTQAADILTAGNGAVGIRIDGSDNKVAVDKQTAVRADGYRGIGVLASYGSGHEITLDGVVTADGKGGVGVRFDFGSSSNGAGDEYRGSYIRYVRFANYTGEEGRQSDGTISDAFNVDFAEHGSYYPATPELDGPLVKNFNLNGSLSGQAQAIYIGKNAFVRNINVNDGAAIRGDIVSEWKHFETEEGVYDADGDAREKLRLRYGGKLYEYDDYIPELVTNLNFNASMDYDGAIRGSDNLKLSVNSHELHYRGTADIVSVNVAEDAVLLGGTYKVNRQQIKHTEKSLDGAVAVAGNDPKAAEDTGNFISRGMIGALNQNGKITDMEIAAVAAADDNAGKFYADGKIRFTAQYERTGQIKINDFAQANFGNIELSFDKNGLYIPDYQYDADKIVLVDGAGKSVDFIGVEKYQTGMMDSIYDGSAVSFQGADNLGVKDEKQQLMFETLEKIRRDHGETNAAYAPLYNLDAERAKESLTSIYGGMQTNLAVAIQKDRYLTDAVYRRLDDEKRGDGNFWFDMQKGWNQWGDELVKDQTLYGAVGADRRDGAWIWGGLLNYGKHDLSGGDSRGVSRDLRLATYGGYQADALRIAVYLAYGRQNHHSERELRNLAFKADSRYHSDIFSLGTKVSYDLQHSQNKIWHTGPYAELAVNRYRQDGFTESGAGVYNQQANSFYRTYATAGCGVELRRDLRDKGSYAFHIGYRRTLSGGDDGVLTNFVIDDGKMFSVAGSESDRNILAIGVQGSVNVRDNLCLSGGLSQEWGKTANQLRLSANAAWVF